MGAGLSSELPQQVYTAAKAGRLKDLTELSRRASQLGPGDELYAQKYQIMEWQDAEGRTALIVAAKKNHAKCVEILLNAGANVHHQSTPKDGGNALHLAVHNKCSREVIDLLLKKGTSPFVENSAGNTALDLAVAQKDLRLIRALEGAGPFAGYLQGKVSKMMGMTTDWDDRWLVVVPKNPYPGLPAEQQIAPRSLLVFKHWKERVPGSTLSLDGARAEIIPASKGKEAHCVLTLHPLHQYPKGIIYVKVREAGSGQQVFLRNSIEVNGRGSLEDFCQIVNHPEQKPTPLAPQLPVQEAPSAGNYPAIQPWGGEDAPETEKYKV